MGVLRSAITLRLNLFMKLLREAMEIVMDPLWTEGTFS